MNCSSSILGCLGYRWLSLLICLLITPVPALAHEARPIVVNITEVLAGVYQAVLTVPAEAELSAVPIVNWPPQCSAIATPSLAGKGTGLMSCPEGFADRELSLDFAVANPSLAVFYSLTFTDGRYVSAMLPPTQVYWRVPADQKPGSVALAYLRLGFAHILLGPDHLLFVLGLLVIARTPRKILLAVTGFTVAHCITLSLAAMGYLTIPIMPVEACIALSIVFLAHEITRQQKDDLTYRMPMLVAFGFGLLHGLGFASALGETGLSDELMIFSLIFFNLGVELGQLVFVALVVAVLYAGYLQLASKRTPRQVQIMALRLDTGIAYLIGVPASFWFVERVSGLFL